MQLCDKNRTGALMSHITSDLFEVTELAHHGPEKHIDLRADDTGALAVMFTMEWRLALVLTIILPLGLWFTLSQRGEHEAGKCRGQRKTAEIYPPSKAAYPVSARRRPFANEDQENNKFDKANDLFRGAKVNYYKAMGMYMSGMEFTTSIMQVAIVAFGGLLIMRGDMNYIDLITFTLYVSTFISPVKRLVQFSETYNAGRGGLLSASLEVMRTEPTVKDKPDAKVLDSVRGEIESRTSASTTEMVCRCLKT